MSIEKQEPNAKEQELRDEALEEVAGGTQHDGCFIPLGPPPIFADECR